MLVLDHFARFILEFTVKFRKQALQIYAPGGLHYEISLKYKLKQSKNSTITHQFPSNYKLAQSIL